MKALAQFVMRGPVHAAGLAVLMAALPFLFWVSAAIVALVMLRVGLTAGFNVALWALLPALGWLWVGQDPTALSVLVEVTLMAMVLRQTASWEKTLVAGSGVALAAGVIVPALLPVLFDQFVQVGMQVLRNLDPEAGGLQDATLETAARSIMLASLAASQFAIALASLMLGRSWQATLFNPGGFRKEFHGLRLSLPVALGLAAAIVILPQLGLNSLLTGAVLGAPLVLAGIALVHGVIGRRGLSGGWLVGFYLLVLVLGPSLFLLLVVIAIFDSWMDFRGRIKPSNQ